MQNISLIISIITVVICVLSFFFNRNNDTKNEKNQEKDASYKLGKMEEKIDNVGRQIDKILNRLDFFDNEIDGKIEKAIQQHEKTYHHS